MVGVESKNAGSPMRYRAPSTAPGTEPRPPMIAIDTMRIDCGAANVLVLTRSVRKAKHTPAAPARKPDSAKPRTLMRTTRTPIAAALVSLSRTAINARATPLSRHSRAASNASTRRPRHTYENARSDDTSMPRNVGRDSNVDAGSGRPVQNVRCNNGAFQHGVGTIDTSISTANASVLTAR